jgi:hypothetical protein
MGPGLVGVKGHAESHDPWDPGVLHGRLASEVRATRKKGATIPPPVCGQSHVSVSGLKCWNSSSFPRSVLPVFCYYSKNTQDGQRKKGERFIFAHNLGGFGLSLLPCCVGPVARQHTMVGARGR